MTNRELANNAAGAIIREAFGDSERISPFACSSWQGELAAIIERECFAAPALAEPPEQTAQLPERPEPKFVQWQWVNWWDEDNDTGTARIAAEPEWNDGEWLYTAEVVADATGPLGEPYTHVLGERTNTLSTHTMTLYDVPPETMHAITHGKPVRVAEYPVDHKGVPFSEPEPPGTVITIADLTGLDGDDGQPVAKTDYAGMFYPWNLEVAEQPEGGA